MRVTVVHRMPRAERWLTQFAQFAFCWALETSECPQEDLLDVWEVAMLLRSWFICVFIPCSE